MQRTITLLGLALVLSTGFVWADDEADILALIDQYNQYQASGDITSQARLMTSDRVFISGRRRQTDQAMNMKQQAALQARNQKQYPGAQVFVTSADPIIRLYGGDAAAASFYWYTNVVLSPDQEGPNPPVSRLIVSLFLVKQGGAWKIAHTHISPLDPPQ